MKFLTQTKELSTLLALSTLDGTTILAAAAGFFTFKNIPIIAFIFLAGPTVMIAATLLQGTITERILVSVFSGIFATLLLIIAASVGPKLLSILNLPLLKATAALTLLSIALLLIDIKLPKNTPLFIILLGITISILWR